MSSVASATINGSPHDFRFDLGAAPNPFPSATLKFTNLRYDIDSAIGMEICVNLRPPCVDMSTLCLDGGKCRCVGVQGHL